MGNFHHQINEHLSEVVIQKRILMGLTGRDGCETLDEYFYNNFECINRILQLQQ